MRWSLSSLRWPALAAAVVIVAAGLTARSQTTGAFAKYAGVALYGSLIYTIVVFVAPRRSPAVAGAIAVGVCWVVELAQLTPFPAEWSARSVVARLVLGSTFSVSDLIWYPIGIALPLGLHGLARWFVTR